MKKKTTIYLDLDGVCVDFAGACLALFGIKKTRRKDVSTWDGIQILVAEELDCTIPEADAILWATVDAGGVDFWSTLKWTPDGKKLLEACQELAEVIVCTTALTPNAAAGKMMWMAKNMPGVAFAITKDKHLLAGPRKVLIDDRDANVDMFNASGGRAVLWPQPWNRAGKAGDSKIAALVIVRAIAGLS